MFRNLVWICFSVFLICLDIFLICMPSATIGKRATWLDLVTPRSFCRAPYRDTRQRMPDDTPCDCASQTIGECRYSAKSMHLYRVSALGTLEGHEAPSCALSFVECSSSGTRQTLVPRGFAFSICQPSRHFIFSSTLF